MVTNTHFVVVVVDIISFIIIHKFYPFVDTNGAKRKHDDILHIDGSANKAPHLDQTDEYTAVESLVSIQVIEIC